MTVFRTPTNRGVHAFVIGAALAALICAPLHSHANTDDASELVDLSLEELLNMEITTLSRKAEDLADAPAAVFVISQTDIARSGARHIPDLLRMVPGMQVAQIDNNKWAVTARGANGLFANKLLVLIDGRSVYSPLLSGVHWDVQDTNIADIDRIEVIRGPGATMWGSNAVNGVVNIITKNAADTHGGAVGLMTNDRAGSEALVRYGSNNGRLNYRVFAKATDAAENVHLSGADAGDSWRTARLGTRLDWSNDSNHSMMFVSELYSNEVGETRLERMPTPPFQTIVDADEDVSGAFAQFRWINDYASDRSLQLLTNLVHEERDGAALSEHRDTFEIDIQHRMAVGDRHDLVWGVGYRNSRDSTEGSFETQIMPTGRTQEIISAFVQDDIRLTEKMRVMVGAKFESNSFSPKSIEVEPSIRFAYRANELNSFWGAVSQSMRTPSRGELDGFVVNTVLPPGTPPFSFPVPIVVQLGGDGTLESEEVTSYELGYRFGKEKVFVDISVFFNENEKLRSVRHGDTQCFPGGEAVASNPACLIGAQYVITPFVLENGFSSESEGVEIWASAEITPSWQLQAAYTYYRSIEPVTANPLQLQFEEDSPEHQLSLRSSMDLAYNVNLDLWIRFVDELRSQQIDEYTALDLRLAWAVNESLEIAGVGRNLIADTHLEFVSELGDLVPIQIEPEAYLEFRWSF